jgi:hypothetical protein
MLFRVTVGGTELYIGGTFLVSIVLMRPGNIFGIGRPYVADTYDYWYQVY